MTNDRDLIRQIAQAGARMDPCLSDRDVERLVAGAAKRRRLRRTRRAVFAGMTTVAAVIALVHVFRNPPPTSTPQPVVVKGPEASSPIDLRILRLADGSTASALDSGTEMSIVEDGADHAALLLARGRGRFNIVHRPARAFEVRAGDVSVTVLGTVFSVERVADRVGVTVEKGTVRVQWRGGAALLQSGGSGWFPPLPTAEPQDRDIAAPSAKLPGRRVSVAPRNELPAPLAPAKPESAEDLLAAADQARLAGRVAEGADLLRKLVRNHRNDARAPLAAFTLGRMLLMELARPLEASFFFAEARRLSPQGPLAEDSMAREAEALMRAGEPALAKSRAKEYLRLYPDGRRTAAVRMIAAIK